MLINIVHYYFILKTEINKLIVFLKTKRKLKFKSLSIYIIPNNKTRNLGFWKLKPTFGSAREMKYYLLIENDVTLMGKTKISKSEN